MLDTNTSSIKSPLVWRVKLQQSRLYAVLYGCALLLALVSLWQCPLHWGVRTLLLLVTLSGGLIIFAATRTSSSLGRREDDSWQLVQGANEYNGQLASGSYRSQWLIVLALKSPQGHVQHAVVWRDAVSPIDFSDLQIRIALTPSHLLL